jgi:hypothetical protein
MGMAELQAVGLAETWLWNNSLDSLATMPRARSEELGPKLGTPLKEGGYGPLHGGSGLPLRLLKTRTGLHSHSSAKGSAGVSFEL